MYQYRIEVNGVAGPVLDSAPLERWTRVAEICDARGGHAILYRRLVLPLTSEDSDLFPEAMRLGGKGDSDGWLVLPWEVFAEIEA